MENWLIDLLGLPEACQVEEVLPQYFLSKNFKLSPSEKNLEKFSIAEMAIVGAISPEYGHVPAVEGMESAAVLVVETKGGKFDKEAGKIANLLHQYIPQSLLIGLTDGNKACLSIAQKNATQQVEEVLVSAFFSPEAMEELSVKFSFDNLDKANLKVLWEEYLKLVM